MQIDEYGKDGSIDKKAALELTDIVVEATRIAKMEIRNDKSKKEEDDEDN